MTPTVGVELSEANRVGAWVLWVATMRCSDRQGVKLSGGF